MGRVFGWNYPGELETVCATAQVMLNPELARKAEAPGLEHLLNSLELQETWDMPLVFPHSAAPSGAASAPEIKTEVISAAARRGFGLAAAHFTTGYSGLNRVEEYICVA